MNGAFHSIEKTCVIISNELHGWHLTQFQNQCSSNPTFQIHHKTNNGQMNLASRCFLDNSKAICSKHNGRK
jgi:hypothetical protein